jgi:hypothetical protein
MKRCVVVALLLSIAATADEAAAQINATGCDLECKNSGTCKFVSEDESTLKALVQAGQLVQRCQCPTGFTGMGCEIETVECNPITNKCSNGVACQKVGAASQEYHCNCAVASTVSTRAWQMCRRTYTEYCSSEYKPDTPLSFCTNGGKCKGSIIAARVAPGNTTVNAKYAHTGCICPTEFYGPHCELLHHSTLAKPIAAPHIPGFDPVPTPSPTGAGTATAFPTSVDVSPENIEDIFNTFDSLNSATEPESQENRGRSAKSNLLVTVLLCVLFAVALVFSLSAFIIYRQRRQKYKLHPVMRRMGRRSRQANVSGSAHQETPEALADYTENTNDCASSLRLEGTADLAPFVVDDEKHDAGDDATADDCTIWTEPTGANSVNKHGSSQEGWIKSFSERMDSLTGGQNGGSIGSEYIVDDDDHSILMDHGAAAYAGSIDRHGVSYLENYRHHAYLVGEEEDMHSVVSGPNWAASVASNGKAGGVV